MMEVGLSCVSKPFGKSRVSEESDSLLGAGDCFVCRGSTTLRCSRCKSVNYCSNTCQRKHWCDGHRKECIPKNSPTAVRSSKSGNKRSGNVNLASQQLRPALTSEGSIGIPKQILFPYDKFLEFCLWDKLDQCPTGLINTGNSCFANAVLQCLTYTRPLAAFLLEGTHSTFCEKRSPCVLCELEVHFQNLRRVRRGRGGGGGALFSARPVLQGLQTWGNGLGNGQQEDAHEFMRFIVDAMQAVCLAEAGGEKFLDLATQETSLIHHIFGGVLKSQVQCLVCHHESARYESVLDLAVEVNGSIQSLEEGLEQFTSPEWLDGDNKYKCDRCKGYVRAGKRLSIEVGPNILTIALKRFQAGRFGKLNKRVSFPSELHISPYMSKEPEPGKAPVYDLYAIIVHLDMFNSSFFGHYVCFVQDSLGRWFKVDDCQVVETNLATVLEQRAYLLFYARRDSRSAPVSAIRESEAKILESNTNLEKNDTFNGENDTVSPNKSRNPERNLDEILEMDGIVVNSGPFFSKKEGESSLVYQSDVFINSEINDRKENTMGKSIGEDNVRIQEGRGRERMDSVVGEKEGMFVKKCETSGAIMEGANTCLMEYEDKTKPLPGLEEKGKEICERLQFGNDMDFELREVEQGEWSGEEMVSDSREEMERERGTIGERDSVPGLGREDRGGIETPPTVLGVDSSGGGGGGGLLRGCEQEIRDKNHVSGGFSGPNHIQEERKENNLAPPPVSLDPKSREENLFHSLDRRNCENNSLVSEPIKHSPNINQTKVVQNDVKSLFRETPLTSPLASSSSSQESKTDSSSKPPLIQSNEKPTKNLKPVFSPGFLNRQEAKTVPKWYKDDGDSRSTNYISLKYTYIDDQKNDKKKGNVVHGIPVNGLFKSEEVGGLVREGGGGGGGGRLEDEWRHTSPLVETKVFGSGKSDRKAGENGLGLKENGDIREFAGRGREGRSGREANVGGGEEIEVVSQKSVSMKSRLKKTNLEGKVSRGTELEGMGILPLGKKENGASGQKHEEERRGGSTASRRSSFESRRGKEEISKGKQGRNEVCNCGSGKKWKKCCGNSGPNPIKPP